MKKIMGFVLIMVMAITLSGCEDYTDQVTEFENDLDTIKDDISQVKEDTETLSSDYEQLYSELVQENANLKVELAELNLEIEGYFTSISVLYSTYYDEDISDRDRVEVFDELLTDYVNILMLLSEMSLFTFDEFEDLFGNLEDLYNDVTEISGLPTFTHIDGFGSEIELPYYISMEYNLMDYVVYQVVYLSDNSRPAEQNFRSTMYIEINKVYNTVRYISFDVDPLNHYNVGVWGDSSGRPEQNFVTYENFKGDFIPWLVGKTSTDLEGISVFSNTDYYGIQNTTNITDQTLIDSFAGSSVSANNMIRIVKEMLEYHNTNYS